MLSNILHPIIGNILSPVIYTPVPTEQDYLLTIPGLVAYWDTTVDESVIRDGALNVSAVIDKGKLGIDLVQPNLSLQPAYDSAGFNGQGALVFDGSSSCMVTNKVLPLVSTQQCTVIICHTSQILMMSNGTARLMCELSENTNSFDTAFYIGYERNDAAIVDGLASVLLGDVGHNGAAFNSRFTNFPQILISELDKSVPDPEVHQYQNGTLLEKLGLPSFNANNTNNFADHLFFVGARNQAFHFFNGVISVMAVYDRVLTTTERAGAFNYLGNKFGIPV